VTWFRRSVVLVLAVAAVVGFALWWHSSLLAEVWGPVDVGGGYGRGGGLGLGLGRGRGGGHTYSDAWAPIVTPMLIIVAVVVVGDWVRLRIKRAQRRARVAR
jgi:hypothetical protein